MIGKEFDAIVKEDIDALVKNAVCESRDTEYKQRLPGGSDEEAREFLADASSLANASGGDLIYGIRDKRGDKGQPTGIPEFAGGLAESNPVAQEARLVSMLRDGVDPRIPAVRIKHLDGFPSGPVIVLRVPKSWASPHMVKFKNLSRFYSRTSAGKYQLDVREIRAAFMASESLTEKISAFRSDRVGKILTGETPIPLEPGPKFVLHLLPMRAFAEPAVVDLRTAQSTLASNGLVPMGPKTNGWGPVQFNFNGLFCNSGSGASAQTESYVQVFRSGAIEAVCSWSSRVKAMIGSMMEQELLNAAPRYIEHQTRLGVGPPLFIAISAISVKGFVIVPTWNPSPFGLSSISPIGQDVLLVPEVQVEEGGVEIKRLLRPALDTIWQASGWPGSEGYDESGEWVGFARFLTR
jgi:hypothetical protein